MEKNAKKIITYHDEYLTAEEYYKNREKYPYAYECPKCNRFVTNKEGYTNPGACEECIFL